MPTVRIGVQIHPKMTGANNEGTRDWSGEEKAYAPQALRDMNPSAILVLDELKWAQQYRDTLPGTLVVYRAGHPREGDFWRVTTPQDIFNSYAPWSSERIIINVGNESHTYMDDSELEKQAYFYGEVLELFGRAGLPVVVPNWGTGHPNLEKLSLFAPIWERLKKYPFHYLGVHEYFSYRGVEIGNGRVGRHENLARWLWGTYGFVPNMLITEHGSDEIDGGLRGWKSSFNGDENRYLALLIEARRKSYNRPWIKGVMIYSWGDANGWPDFDISAAKTLHAGLAQENKIDFVQDIPNWMKTPVPQPEPSPVKPIIIPDWMQATHHEMSKVNVRQQPKPKAAIVTTLKMDIPFWMCEAPNVADWWVVIAPDGKVGFVAKWALTPTLI